MNNLQSTCKKRNQIVETQQNTTNQIKKVMNLKR
jgi:hypothetical protein